MDGKDMTVTVSLDVARLLQDAVSAGGYGSTGDAIRDAATLLRLEQERGEWFGYTAEEIDRLIDEADAGGPAREVDFEEIKRIALHRAGAVNPGR